MVDYNSDGYISKLENNKGQIVGFEFNKIDVNRDGLITELELNNYFPYSEVVWIMNRYSDSKTKPCNGACPEVANPTMNLFDFYEFYYHKKNGNSKCSEMEITDSDNHRDITKCSDGSDCYDLTNNIYDNNKCI